MEGLRTKLCKLGNVDIQTTLQKEQKDEVIVQALVTQFTYAKDGGQAQVAKKVAVSAKGVSLDIATDLALDKAAFYLGLGESL